MNLRRILLSIALVCVTSLYAMEKKSMQRSTMQKKQGQRGHTPIAVEKKPKPKEFSLSKTEKQYEQESTDYKKWLFYADQDVMAAKALMTYPNEFPNQAITLSVQGGEKSLKAFLTYKKVKLTRTHDLQKLFENCKKFADNFEELNIFIHRLTSQPPGLRYPSRNTLINPDGISDYKRKVIKMVIESAQNIYKFVVEKIDDEQKSSTIRQVIKPKAHELLEAIKHNDAELAEALLEQGVSINARNENGDTALIMAVDLSIRNRPSSWTDRQKNKAIVKLLLQNNADINLQNNEGETALFYAAGVAHPHLSTPTKPPTGFSSIKLVKLLLKNDADVTIQNRNGETVFTVKQMPHVRKKNIFELMEKHLPQ